MDEKLRRRLLDALLGVRQKRIRPPRPKVMYASKEEMLATKAHRAKRKKRNKAAREARKKTRSRA